METDVLPRAAPVLEARELSKEFDGQWALRGLDLTIGSGDICCLLGANGAGKTTTINLFLGFLKPSSGEARVCGHTVSDNPIVARRSTVYIPEIVRLYEGLTGVENLRYFTGLAGLGLSSGELEEFLLQAGLPEDALHRRSGTYSKGMRQKVGIAIALAKRARALLLDEPTAGLDPGAAAEFSALLRRLSDEGCAILMATHDLFRVKDIGSRAAIMRQGRLRAVLEREEIEAADLEEVYLQHMGVSE